MYLQFTKDANRLIVIDLRNARTGDKGRKVAVYPAKTLDVIGDNGTGEIDLCLSWCPNQVDSSCADPITATVEMQNTPLGYPQIRVGKDRHGFKALERYTFEEAYGHEGDKGIARFKAQRLTDMATGNNPKRFEVDFTLAAPPAR